MLNVAGGSRAMIEMASRRRASSWRDYDPAAISEGGGVFARSAWASRPCTIARPPTARMWSDVIDHLREQIQQRLEQLAGEADRLRKALTALDPRGPSEETEASATKPPAPKSAPARRQVAKPATRSPRRTAPGATKASVLEALAGGEAMTAGEVAAGAGLARATVSTTLSRLVQSGEVRKAERGYRLPSAGEPSVPSPARAGSGE